VLFIFKKKKKIEILFKLMASATPTVEQIAHDRITKIASNNWLVEQNEVQFNSQLIDDMYLNELVKTK
jgi:hypothetical protein